MSPCAITICLLLNFTQSEKILGIFPTPARSHFNLGFRLMKALADRGHEVTAINPFPQKNPIKNYREIIVEDVIEALEEMKKYFYKRETFGPIQNVMFIHDMGFVLTEKLLANEKVQNLLQTKNETFDLVIMEYFLNEAVMGIGKHFSTAPTILLSTLPSSTVNNYLFSNPTYPSSVPYLLGQYSGHMNFWERCINLYYNTIEVPRANKTEFEEIIYNCSLILLNSHPSINDAVSHVPSMIEIGGFHVNPSKNQLGDSLKEFLENSRNGAIIFSMGSNLKSADLDVNKRNALLTAFSKIKQNVLWKWEDEEMSSLPSNVKLLKWLPQQEILAHPNIQAFISHCGLLSIIEAVYFGVPVIGIPVFGDQKMNIANAVMNGYAVSVPFQELTEEKMSWALNEILNNSKYRETAKKRSKIMLDRPIKPIDLAMYWIEYVMHYKGAQHLRVAGLQLIWYQKYLIDVILFLIVSIALIILFCSFVIKKIV